MISRTGHLNIYRLFSYSLCLLLAIGFPVSVFAETPTTTTVSQPTDSATTTVPVQEAASTTPVPSTSESVDSSATPTKTTEQTSEPTKTESSDTKSSEAIPEKNYYYDSETQRWNTDSWKYDPVSGTYKEVPKAVVITPTESGQPKDEDKDIVREDEESASAIDTKTMTDISNVLDSLAKTGDASVLGNTSAGSATSGDASATARVINNVNSTLTNANNKEAATFVSDVMGDVNGDIILQPMLLKAMLEAGSVNAAENQTINSANTTNIKNDIDLTATSGDATVAKNTSAGDATSGSTSTVADVVNIVNSMISANQSFMGTINIYGNLNGDILVAPDFLSQLLAENSDSAVFAQSSQQSQEIDVDNTQKIVNNIALAAESGKAAVDKNTSAGSAKSGDAETNVVLFNLSGHEIVASNSMLVFVNVLGKWVGVIVDAPTGATAAAIGNGVVQNSITSAPSMKLNSINDTTITNNINLASRSGDANVAGNSFAGNATSGNATASANIANITNSQLGLSGWFGVLFINVFGTWVGSFGVDTNAGDMVAAASAASSARTMSNSGAASSGQPPLQVLAYVPRVGSAQPIVNTTLVTPAGAQENAAQAASVRAAQVRSKPYDATATKATNPAGRTINIPVTIGSIMLTLGSLYVLRRFLF